MSRTPSGAWMIGGSMDEHRDGPASFAATAAGGKNTLLVRDGILESSWRPGCFVDADDARDAIEAAAGACGGIPMPMLSEMTDVVISPAARYVFAQASHVSAIAVLGSSIVDRVLAAAMNRHTDYPHRFFTSRMEAVAWLHAQATPAVTPGGVPDPDAGLATMG